MTNPFDCIANDTARYFTHEGRVIGFDTNHLGDGHHPDAELADRNQIFPFQTYYGGAVHIWTWEEVEAETRRLAEQAKDTTNE